MAYEPTTWATGDVITAEKLNKIENGIVDKNPLVVNITAEYGDLSEDVYGILTNVNSNKTTQEIIAAINSNVEIIFTLTVEENKYNGHLLYYSETAVRILFVANNSGMILFLDGTDYSTTYFNGVLTFSAIVDGNTITLPYSAGTMAYFCSKYSVYIEEDLVTEGSTTELIYYLNTNGDNYTFKTPSFTFTANGYDAIPSATRT